MPSNDPFASNEVSILGAPPRFGNTRCEVILPDIPPIFSPSINVLLSDFSFRTDRIQLRDHSGKIRDREGALTRTRGACAPQIHRVSVFARCSICSRLGSVSLIQSRA